MLKSIGSLHNVPAPSAAVLGESLKLLATFGDKKSIGTLLEQMQDVQAKNEQVFRDAQAVIGELTVMRKELNDSQMAFAYNSKAEGDSIKHRSEELSQAEARLSGKAAKFDEEQEAALSALGANKTDLASRERTVAESEAKNSELERDLEKWRATLSHKEKALLAKEQQLQARENKLRAVLDGG